MKPTPAEKLLAQLRTDRHRAALIRANERALLKQAAPERRASLAGLFRGYRMGLPRMTRRHLRAEAKALIAQLRAPEHSDFPEDEVGRLMAADEATRFFAAAALLKADRQGVAR